MREAGSAETTLHWRCKSDVSSSTTALSGKDEITHWFSRNWYDLAGTGDVRHFRAGTNVEHLYSVKAVFCYVSKYLSKVDREAVCQYLGQF